MQILSPKVSDETGPLPEGDEISTAIASAGDIVTARRRARGLARSVGFGSTDLTLIAAAISETARNIVDHAKEGSIVTRIVQAGGRRGVRIVARDRGPGIPDVAQVMQYGRATSPRIGIGLPGVKWLVDEFDIVSSAGGGTTVTMTKWLPQ